MNYLLKKGETKMKRTAKKLTLYEKVMGYSMTWAEEAVDAHPLISGAVGAVVIWALFL